MLPDSAVFGSGPYPLFVQVPGTHDLYDVNVAMLFVDQMAARGSQPGLAGELW